MNQPRPVCGTCKRFPVCFGVSKTLLDVAPELVTELMVDGSAEIPSCPEYQPIEVKPCR
jgi:hypothetical protein